MTETFVPRAGFGPIGHHAMPLEDRIPEVRQVGRAKIRCYLCGSILRPTWKALMDKGARCKCGALTIPGREI